MANHQQSKADIVVLGQSLSGGNQIVSQSGKYVINLGQGAGYSGWRSHLPRC
ncbi:hypothetical protein [Microcoleus sp. PH2017_13_LAR_U_A]|uniref:hypothetical protein n=1 Tax=unclassified Microcoleus TaxID=2642155 RepID=UPI003444C94B